MTNNDKQLNNKWLQLMVAAEQTTSRKEGRHIINEATKLRERMSIPFDEYPTTSYTWDD